MEQLEMFAEKKYLHYSIPNSGTHLLGENKSQIIETLWHYKNRGTEAIDIPDESEIKEITGATITCCFPMAHTEHFLEAEVRQNIILDVNANAYDWVQRTGQNYESLKRGGLYKFQTLPLFGLYFLCEDIMKGIKEYDWKKHEPQINEWLGIREDVLNEAERRGHVRRG